MRTSERSFGPAPATRSAGAQALESSFRLEKTGLSGNEPRILPNLQRILISKGRIFSLGCRHADKKKGRINSSPSEFWSGRRVSNSRPQPWQGCALPTELLPHVLRRMRIIPEPRALSRADWKKSLQHKKSRIRQASCLTGCGLIFCFERHALADSSGPGNGGRTRTP